MAPCEIPTCVAQLYPPSISHQPNPYTMRTTCYSPSNSVCSRHTTTKEHSLARRNVRKILRDDQRSQHAFLATRDAVINVQAQFFDALRHLYTWPLKQLTFGITAEARDHWAHHLEEARKCAYRSETIDPNYPGPLRYDIMLEIINLETRRINEFLSAFDHYSALINTHDINEEDQDDESYCDQTLLSYLDQIQTNVVLSIPPKWIEDARRPPLTWYGFLSPERKPNFLEILPREEQILAPAYYE